MEEERERGVLDTVSVDVPREVKEEILNVVKDGRYESVSDFLMKAIHRQLDEKTDCDDNVLNKTELKRFIEKIS